MVFFAPCCGVIGNIVGMKWVLVAGTLGFLPYSAGLYCIGKYGSGNGYDWILLFGAATCGLSASALWTAEAAIGVGYPEKKNRGLYSKTLSCPLRLFYSNIGLL